MNRLRLLYSNLPDWRALSLNKQLVILLVMLIVFVLGRLLLFLLFGQQDAFNALAMIPLTLAAWFFGLRVGLFFNVPIFLASTLIVNLTGEATGWDAGLKSSTGAIGPALGVVGTIVVGQLSDVQQRLKQELVQRVLAEKALQESEARLHMVVSNAPLVFYTLNQQGIFTLFEGQGLKAIGWQPGQFVGQSIFQVYRDNPPVLDSIRHALNGHECTLTTTVNGFVFDAWYEPVRDEKGRVKGVVGVAYDVTAREQAEEALRQARDAALEASRFKSSLLATVSHELLTPLGAILGYAEMIQDGVLGPVTPQQSSRIEKIIRNNQYLTGLINELLDHARLESGKLELHLAPFAPAELLANVITQMEDQARVKGLKLDGQVDETLPKIAQGDSRRLHQILVNLVGNAIKFTEQGDIWIRFYRAAAARWALEVADTGSGIPPEAQEHIFESFWQLDSSVTRRHPGAGLGLSIVKQLAELMGGKVSLESDGEHGSIFTVYLPLEEGT